MSITKSVNEAIAEYRVKMAKARAEEEARKKADAEFITKQEDEFRRTVYAYLQNAYDVEIEPASIQCVRMHGVDGYRVTIKPFPHESGCLAAEFYCYHDDWEPHTGGWQAHGANGSIRSNDFIAALAYLAPETLT